MGIAQQIVCETGIFLLWPNTMVFQVSAHSWISAQAPIFTYWVESALSRLRSTVSWIIN